MSVISDALMERIRAVKAMTGSTNENEAAVAATMLAKMLQEHDLKLSEIQESQDTREQIIEKDWDCGKSENWKVILSQTIAGVMFCRCYRDNTHKVGSQVQYLRVFVGHESDVEVATYMMDALSQKIESLAKIRTAEYAARLRAEQKRGSIPGNIYTVSGNANPFVFKRSWITGAVETVCAALREQYQTFKTSSLKGNELVVTKGKLVNAFYFKAHPNMKSVNVRTRVRNGEGYSLGKADGASIKAYRGVGGRASSVLALGSGS